MSRPGGYYAKPLPDEAAKDQTAYVDGKGRRVDITPENAKSVARYAAGRPAKAHARFMSTDSTPSTVATAPTGEESRRNRDAKASDVYHRNAITPPYVGPKRPYRGAQVREWGISA
ncbi:hypothetical protein ACFTUC_17420 [Streptomyces sp. NPDC056944]|uniref:hypothetical protein n=1 Tax=Streptomyces sp. NPDC056944 TaxID=3345972 RepID=UPI0036406E82